MVHYLSKLFVAKLAQVKVLAIVLKGQQPKQLFAIKFTTSTAKLTTLN